MKRNLCQTDVSSNEIHMDPRDYYNIAMFLRHRIILRCQIRKMMREDDQNN